MAKSVAIVIDPYGMGFIQGIAKYARTQSRWRCSLVPDWQATGGELPDWSGDGIIVQLFRPEFAELLQSSKPKVVNVSSIQSDWDFPTVIEDSVTIGRMAAAYFIERGYRSFAFVGDVGAAYADLRFEGFRNEIVQRGLDAPGRYPGIIPVTMADVHAFVAWMKSRPWPVGLLAANDVAARQCLRALIAQDVLVPEEVAVIGVDNDPVMCELSAPPITSIDRNAERIGFEAARLLDGLMDGQQPPNGAVLVPPAGVVERQSTQSLAVEDDLLQLALRFIRDNAENVQLSVGDIAAAVGMNQRSLERRFRRHLDHSPREELIRVRMEKARTLLRETGMGLDQVAEHSGFADASYLCRTFKRHEGSTPTQYRKKHQLA